VAYIQIIPAAFLLAAVQLLEAQTIFNPAPSRIVGQAVLQQQGVLTAIAPNLVEGREFNNPQAVAIDTSVTPHILYVADFGNNRVLAWKRSYLPIIAQPCNNTYGTSRSSIPEFGRSL